MTSTSISREAVDVVLTLCEDLASPRALTVAILIRYQEWDQLARLRVDPLHYSDPHQYWCDAVATSFLRKAEDLPTSFDRKAKAVENFWKAEKQCYRTNLRLRPFLYGCQFDPKEEGAYKFLLEVRKNVERILGPCPTLIEGRHGPGATYGDRGRLTTVPDKMSSRPTLTSSALYHLFQWSGTAWASACAESKRDPEVVRGNRFTTVPKDCEKDRGIAIEPSINLFYQLGLGQVIRRRLLAAGIDLQRGQEIHKRVACEASLSGSLATLDLSNASDTVSKDLVKFLLPTRWFDALDSLRSPCTWIDGKWVTLEKFSSMGNGFTFELETLVFLAIAMACVSRSGIEALPGVNIFVYGDDIIVPTESVSNVLTALEFLGFSVNEEKSFFTGHFRESCGGDYFRGVDVRPFFLKEFPYEPQHFIALANGVRRLASADGRYSSRHSIIRRAWFRILDAVPSNVRKCRGPEDLGDIVIHDEPSRWQTRWRSGIRYLRCYRPARFVQVGWEHWRAGVVLATALYGLSDGRKRLRFGDADAWDSGGVTPRNPVLGYKQGWVPRS